jgi:hypothetical protein
MKRAILNEQAYEPHEYASEADFERDIVENSKEIFGLDSLYIDVKRRIGKENIVTIPDGYLLDFSFPSEPRLYIIENELSSHDPYRHIGQQLLRFAISYRLSGRRIKKFLLREIMKTPESQRFVSTRFEKAGFRNIDAFLEDVIFEKDVAAIVVIDQANSDLENVLAQLTMKTDILEFQTFEQGDERLHVFTPFQQELRASTERKGRRLKLEELDTIVVPAREDGFNEVFLGEDCWYEISMSSSMIERVKYIAAYQTAPVSAITHYAEVKVIEKYKDTHKYIVYFKEPAKEIGPITLPKGTGLAPQAPRYTRFEKLKTAKTLSDAF